MVGLSPSLTGTGSVNTKLGSILEFPSFQQLDILDPSIAASEFFQSSRHCLWSREIHNFL